MEFVSLEEAARRLGVSVTTVRRKLHAGELKGFQRPIPQGFLWEIELPEGTGLDPASQPSTDTTEGFHDTHVGELEALHELVDVLKVQVQAQQVELEARRKEVSELHILLQQSQKSLPAPTPRRSWWARLWRS